MEWWQFALLGFFMGASPGMVLYFVGVRRWGWGWLWDSIKESWRNRGNRSV